MKSWKPGVTWSPTYSIILLRSVNRRGHLRYKTLKYAPRGPFSSVGVSKVTRLPTICTRRINAPRKLAIPRYKDMSWMGTGCWWLIIFELTLLILGITARFPIRGLIIPYRLTLIEVCCLFSTFSLTVNPEWSFLINNLNHRQVSDLCYGKAPLKPGSGAAQSEIRRSIPITVLQGWVTTSLK